jgi:hypothetical protein
MSYKQRVEVNKFKKKKGMPSKTESIGNAGG